MLHIVHAIYIHRANDSELLQRQPLWERTHLIPPVGISVGWGQGLAATARRTRQPLQLRSLRPAGSGIYRGSQSPRHPSAAGGAT